MVPEPEMNVIDASVQHSILDAVDAIDVTIAVAILAAVVILLPWAFKKIKRKRPHIEQR